MKIITKEEFFAEKKQQKQQENNNNNNNNNAQNDIESSVRTIIYRVRKEGDSAVKEYTELFDTIDFTTLKTAKVSDSEIKEAYEQVDKETITALKKAADNIRKFAEMQLKSIKEFTYTFTGITLKQKILPIKRVGCYVPGGNYPLPSTALMTVIPAKTAGVKEVIVCSPKIKPVTIVAADIAGADAIYRIGGVQAIAAMAFGTETIQQVDKIVGPGNNYVTEAKRQVYGNVGIDFLAGPSEVLIIADKSGNQNYIAADLLAQAEHDTHAIPNLITFNEKIARKVNQCLADQLKNLPTKEIAEKSLNNGRIILVADINEAITIANMIAPEHLELQVNNKLCKEFISRLMSYGSLFIGKNAAEVYGDYAAGPDHTLPTNGAARYTGGLSVFDFIKIVTSQKLNNNGVKELQRTTSKIAEVEGLYAHKNAAEIRLKKIQLK